VGKPVAISQSNYIPWKGYFDSIKKVDEFVLYDDMQYTRRDWRNRNKIKTAQGIQWLTIPVEVKGKFHQKINETLISDRSWNEQHWKTLKLAYAKAKRFAEVKEFVEGLYRSATMENLSLINHHFLKNICDFLGITTPLRFSSEFTLSDDKTGRLVGICRQLNATDYYSGPAAKNYMDESMFERENIQVHYYDYSGYTEYDQLHPPFEHGVSILDLIFNEGREARLFLQSKV
jgi:hypothetical protein